MERASYGGGLMSGSRITVDYTAWEGEVGKFNELGRRYDFKNLGGPGTQTCVDLRCRLNIEDGPTSRWSWNKRGVKPFVYLVIDPYLLEQTKTCTAIFGPVDDLVNYKILTARVEAAATGVSFVVFDVSDAEHIVNMLLLGRPLSLNLITQEGESIGRIPLFNDMSFKAEYESFRSKLLNEPAKTDPAKIKSADTAAPLQVWTHVPENGRHPVWLVKLDSKGELDDAFVVNSLPNREAQQSYAINLAKWLKIAMCDVRRS